VALDRDDELRRASIHAVRELSGRFDDIVPVAARREGFIFAGERISFGSFYSGIFRPRQMRGPVALTITTAPPKLMRDAH
jgi:deferrochelatase/peroxidase EfeB